jgi:hypothetical protein
LEECEPCPVLASYTLSSALQPRKKHGKSSVRVEFIIIIGGILVLFIYITKLASNEIFSPSNKIHREEGWAKDLSASRYQ